VPVRPEFQPTYTVVVPLSNPDTVETLLDIARPLAEARNGRIVATTVVKVPRQLAIHEGMKFTHHKEPLLRIAREYGAEHKVPVETRMVIAHNVHEGVLQAAKQNHADLVVMGWKGYSNTRERVFGEVVDRIIRHAPCDLILFKIGANRELRRCLLPTSGGPNARLAADILNTLGKAYDMKIDAGHVVSPEATQEERAESRRWIDKTLTHIDPALVAEKRLIESTSVAGGIAKASRDFDLVVIGASKEPLFRKLLVGNIAEKVARYSPTSVMVVKRYEGAAKSMFKDFFG